MTKAEKRAMEAYPVKRREVTTSGSYQVGRNEWRDYDRHYFVDDNEENRNKFLEGYEAAEKDLGWISVKDDLPKEDEK